MQPIDEHDCCSCNKYGVCTKKNNEKQIFSGRSQSDVMLLENLTAYLSCFEVAIASRWGDPAIRNLSGSCQASINLDWEGRNNRSLTYASPLGTSCPATPASPLSQVTNLMAPIIALSLTSQFSELACTRPMVSRLLTYLACRVSRDAGAILNITQTNMPRTPFHALSGMRQTVTQRRRKSSPLQTAGLLRTFLYMMARA